MTVGNKILMMFVGVLLLMNVVSMYCKVKIALHLPTKYCEVRP